MADVLLLRSSPGAFDPRTTQALEEGGLTWATLSRAESGPDQWSAALKDARAILVGAIPLTRADIQAAPRLRLICRAGAGLDNLDLAAARDHGVAVSYAPDAPAPAVAELALGLLLDLARGITLADRRTRAGRWDPPMGRRLGEMTVGILGAGRIGLRLIHLLQPFRCRILAHDRSPHALLAPDLGVERVGLDELLSNSDIVSIHLPLTPDTRHLLDARRLALLRPEAALVNTSRGGIVHEGDLHRALSSGRLHSAALDVFEEEPYTGPLMGLDNVVLTQHMGSRAQDCRLRMELEAAEEAVRFLRGGVLRYPVPVSCYPT